MNVVYMIKPIISNTSDCTTSFIILVKRWFWLPPCDNIFDTLVQHQRRLLLHCTVCFSNISYKC